MNRKAHLTTLHLTKSHYIAGLQCLRRLWLIVNEPLPYEPRPPGSLVEIGEEIGRKARLLFPGGVLVDEGPSGHARAATRTAALMSEEPVPAVFEGTFEFDGIRIRADALERLTDMAWGLREVKGSTGLKDHYLDDIAVQAYVLKGAGIKLSSIELIHVNSAYVRGPSGVNWTEFFARVDVTDAVAARIAKLPARLAAMRACVHSPDLPAAEPGNQCGTPYDCEFWDRCTADKPADWIARLPRLSKANAAQLKALGVDAISAIPPGFPLTPKQVVIRDAVADGKPYVSNDLLRLLKPFGPPACYLDFEAMMPPIPLYEGMRPYQTLPFQWSLHTIGGDGVLSHEAFLADGVSDPRLKFAETLIMALASSDVPIIVYSPYEQTRLRELAAEFPDLSAALSGVIARLADLLPIVRSSVYLREFEFSNSIKSVAPALCPSFSYDDLDGIADGAAAAGAFLQIASGALAGPDEIANIRCQLLAYCERDTLAMVEAHRALKRLAAQTQN